MRIPVLRHATTVEVAVSALVIFGVSLTAQVPENAAVVGTGAWQGAPGTSGVFYVSLKPGGAITPLSSLPPELTVAPGGFGGAWSVLRRPSDGTLFVGDGATNAKWCHVHVLKMAGARAASSRSVRVGQVGTTGQQQRIVGGLALLPDGRVIVSAGPFAAGPMAGSPVAILDDRPTTPTVTPVRVTSGPAGPFMYGAALSPDGRTAYAVSHADARRGFAPARLYEIDLTRPSQPVAPVLLHTWSRCLVPKITANRDGVLYATCVDAVSANPAPSIEEIRVLANKTVVVKRIPVSSPTAIVGPALERGTGRFVFVSAVFRTTVQNNSVLTSDRNGRLSLLTGPPPGGWGVPFAIDVNSAFETYGTGTDATNSYSFVDFPNPGGQPAVGSPSFGLTVEWSPAKTVPAQMMVGTKAVDVNVLGLRLLAQPEFVLPMASQPGIATFPLPIPNNVTLRGLTLFAQSLHFEPALATSNGLRIDIH